MLCKAFFQSSDLGQCRENCTHCTCYCIHILYPFILWFSQQWILQITCVIVDLVKGDNFSSSVSLSEWVLQMKLQNILEMWRPGMSKTLSFKALSGYQSMQVDICNWQFFSGFIAIHYWDATQMLNSPKERCIFSTIEGFFDKIYRLAWLPTHTPHTQKELLTQNLQARSGFSSVKLSPLLLPTLISTFHISLSSKQLRHNVPIRGNYPHSSNYYVIFLHFRGVEYKCLVSAEAIWGWRC